MKKLNKYIIYTYCEEDMSTTAIVHKYTPQEEIEKIKKESDRVKFEE